MKSKNLTVFSSALVLSLAMAACGEKSDNKSPDESTETTTSGGSTGTSTDEANSFFPTVDYSLPSNLALSLSLTGDSAESGKESAKVTIIQRQAQRGEQVVERLNEVMERLNKDAVDGVGSFSGKGPDGLISGKVEELAASDDGYAYNAVLCYNAVPFMHIKWSEDQKVIEAVNDLSKAPIKGKDPASMLSFVKFTKGEAGNNLVLRSTGTPWKQPPFATDGDMLSEYSVADIGADGTFTMKAVVDRFAELPETFSGDEYLVGHIDANQGGEFVGYQKADTENCPSAFDEAQAEGPGFCVGRQLGSETPYNADEIAAAWGRLTDFGLLKANELSAVKLDATLTCE